jgi:hypothetical protein
MIGDGKNLHHLIHIDDLIDAFSLAAEHPEAIGNIFVVAGEEPVTTNEMVAVIAARMGTRIPGYRVPLSALLFLATVMEKTFQPFGIKPPIYRRRMDFFRKNFAFSQEKAKKILGFRPNVGFSEGISATAEWYQSMNLLAMHEATCERKNAPSSQASLDRTGPTSRNHGKGYRVLGFEEDDDASFFPMNRRDARNELVRKDIVRWTAISAGRGLQLRRHIVHPGLRVDPYRTFR